MSDNTQRFTGRAEVYERYRQRYPNVEVLALMKEWCGLTADWVVADVGAGTGMLAEVFLENGNRVIAIEPNEEMREACARLSSPLLEVVDATAEATGLADASVEMVAAGRAFHWFDKEKSLAEFRRVLKPGGWLALVSVGRAQDESEQLKGFGRLLVEYGMDYDYVRAGYRVHEQMEELFGEMRQGQIAGEQLLRWEEFRGQTMSLSVVPQVGDAGYAVFQEKLREHFDEFALGGVLRMAITCWVTVGRW